MDEKNCHTNRADCASCATTHLLIALHVPRPTFSSPLLCVRSRSPTTGAVAIGWGSPPSVQGSPGESSFKRTPSSFKRTSAATVPNLLSSSPTLVRRTPTTVEALAPRSAPSAAPPQELDEAELDACIVDCVQSAPSREEAQSALETLLHNSPVANAPSAASPRGPTRPEATTATTPDATTVDAPSPNSRWRARKVSSEEVAERHQSLSAWEAEKRHQHASRLLSASAKASKRAARKMLAMATNESLRTTSALPAASASPEHAATAAAGDVFDGLRESVLPPAGERAPPSLEADKYILPAHVVHSPTPAVARDAQWEVVLADKRIATKAGPLECLLLGVQAVLGCDAGLR